jgi:hypothetical protein
MASKKTPEEIAANWKKRADRIKASVPRSFKAGVRKAWAIDTQQMQQEVYGGGNKWGSPRSATLLRLEQYRDVSTKEAHITNRAKTKGGEYYAWYIHDGVGSQTAPTSGGKPAWVWMKGGAPRPTSKSGWKAARKAGAVIASRKLAARAARRWRFNCRKEMQRAVSDGIANGLRDSYRT